MPKPMYNFVVVCTHYRALNTCSVPARSRLQWRSYDYSAFNINSSHQAALKTVAMVTEPSSLCPMFQHVYVANLQLTSLSQPLSTSHKHVGLQNKEISGQNISRNFNLQSTQSMILQWSGKDRKLFLEWQKTNKICHWWKMSIVVKTNNFISKWPQLLEMISRATVTVIIN